MTSAKTIAAAGAAVIGLFALQQTPFIVRGVYFRQVVWQSGSPDQRYRLEIARRATFPAFDILDPAGIAYFTVIDMTTGGLAAHSAVPLMELFDVQPPKVTWSSKEVDVLEFDESRPAAMVRLRLAE